jgi:hypothetical protein
MRDRRLLIPDVKIVRGGISLAYGKLASFERRDDQVYACFWSTAVPMPARYIWPSSIAERGSA